MANLSADEALGIREIACIHMECNGKFKLVSLHVVLKLSPSGAVALHVLTVCSAEPHLKQIPVSEALGHSLTRWPFCRQPKQTYQQTQTMLMYLHTYMIVRTQILYYKCTCTIIIIISCLVLLSSQSASFFLFNFLPVADAA